MGRLEHLRESLPLLAKQACKIIVVDYSCPDQSGTWVEFFRELTHYRNVHVVYCPGEKYFNKCRASNAGARVALTEYLCFMDVDNLASPNLVQELEKAILPGSFLHLSSKEIGLVGFVLCRKADWAAVEGYDEGIRGYGFEDTQFKFKLMSLGLRQITLNKDLVSHISHEDKLRVQNYQVQDMSVTSRDNTEYGKRKVAEFEARIRKD
jgi:glycosyltransferase involved in cell wall biosynthesis